MESRIALIGVGAWGKNHLRVWKELDVLSVVCETDPLRSKSLQEEFPGVKVTSVLHDVLKAPEIRGVVIATPAETHFRLAKECLLAKKDVFVEKPLALAVRDGIELVELAKGHGRVLMVGHILQFHPAVQKLTELVQRGDLGKINYLYSNRLNFGKIRTEENILWSFAPHDISVMLMLLNEMPTRVASQGGNYLHRSIADVTVSNFQFKSGSNAHIFVSWLHPYKEQKLVVVGDRQMAVFDDVAGAQKLVLYPHKINWINRQPVSERAGGVPVEYSSKEPLLEECLHFLDCIRTRQKPRTDGEEGLRVLAVLNACQLSLEQEGSNVNPAVLSAEFPSTTFFVHPTCCIDEPVEIGEGTKIWHFSHIMKGAKIGKNCNIGQNVVISPHCILGQNVKVQNNVSIYTGVICEDDVFLGPSMVFTNVVNPRSHIPRRDEYRQTLVKKGASIGANATIVCGKTIGRYAFVGAGAVVTRDVPDYALVVGNPARQVGWICQCGERLHFEEDSAVTLCAACQCSYEKEEQQLRPL